MWLRLGREQGKGMIANGQTITNYIRDRFKKEKHEVFLLLERKTDSVNPDTLNYNFYAYGEPYDKLQSLAKLIEMTSKEMGLSFEETLEVLAFARLQDRTIIRGRYLEHIKGEWSVLE